MTDCISNDSELDTTIAAAQQCLAAIRVVLIHTRHPGNIGGTARAMKNMGLSQLYLVAPKLFPDGQAQARAAGAEDILEQAVICETLDEALSGCRLVVGSSARERRIPWPLLDAHRAARRIIGDVQQMQSLRSAEPSQYEQAQHEPAQPATAAILFGREDRGLTNEELQRCNFHMTIPSNPQYSSLNLAAAVQVFCYELRMAALNTPQIDTEWDVPPASSDDLHRYFEHLQRVLINIAFIDDKAPRQTMTRLRRLYHRVRPDEMELAMLRGILGQTEKALTNAKRDKNSKK